MPHRMRPMRTSRTVNGLRSDDGDWFRCPTCNFPIRKSKTSTPTRASILYEDAIVAACPMDNVTPDMLICGLEHHAHDMAMMAIGDDGTNPIEVYYAPRTFTPQAGCPACGRVWLD